MTILSPTAKSILRAAKRLLRDKRSVVMTSGTCFDKAFKNMINTALGCEFSDRMLNEEMEFLVRHMLLDKIVKDDEYGKNTTHYMGDPE